LRIISFIFDHAKLQSLERDKTMIFSWRYRCQHFIELKSVCRILLYLIQSRASRRPAEIDILENGRYWWHLFHFHLPLRPMPILFRERNFQKP
jgi:hypothetical protein